MVAATNEMVIGVGSRVCRRSARDYRAVGTVIRVWPRHAEVKWDVSLATGTTHIGCGDGHRSKILLSALVLASAWKKREVRMPKEEEWIPQFYQLRLHDGRGVLVYGQNSWTFQANAGEDAIAQAEAMASSGKRVTLARCDIAKIVPAGCRTPREFSQWVTLMSTR